MSHGVHVGHHSHEGGDAGGRAFDPFELSTAILLGSMAVGAAVATMQAGNWNAKQLDAFAESNALTTKAATQYNEDTALMNADIGAVAIAKQHILEARDAKNPVDRERNLDLASYFYESQLSEAAYKAMKLPAGYWEENESAKTKEEKDSKAHEAKAPEAKGAEKDQAAEPPGDEAAALERNIPDAALLASLKEELDDAYVKKMSETGTEMFDEADKRFSEGREANENRDHFDLVEVIYTVGLVFAGLGLVFKTRMRWGMFGIGTLVFVIATIWLARLPWTH